MVKMIVMMIRMIVRMISMRIKARSFALPNMNLDVLKVTKLTLINLMMTMRNTMILLYSQNHLDYSDVIILRVASNYQRGHTGQMSLITAAMNAAGLLVGLLILKAGIWPG